ncbi:hypothetical protein [Rathayibacter sp. VKM Ac-2630]|uniref:hypothetical protein n=1 Tax=Rathayibacter sp. VKM Ac-2630 TaxID=1938617 RepID=UPI0009812707|nr:hypothetical protein [Rathayibacter sp. VKM Ac-2630]OOB90494.1 hypothetical protein B0T42_11335 [Rathayibacter sp. VKM Ac-2630]
MNTSDMLNMTPQELHRYIDSVRDPFVDMRADAVTRAHDLGDGNHALLEDSYIKKCVDEAVAVLDKHDDALTLMPSIVPSNARYLPAVGNVPASLSPVYEVLNGVVPTLPVARVCHRCEGASSSWVDGIEIVFRVVFDRAIVQFEWCERCHVTSPLFRQITRVGG